MLTAGRLAGAIVFATLGWYVATLTIPQFSEGRAPRYFVALFALSGAWAGWFICGKNSGNGFGVSMSHGLTSVVAMVFWVLFLMSGSDMIRKSLRKLYHGPTEAVVDVANLMWKHMLNLPTNEVIATLLIGGLVCGFLTEIIGRRYS